MVDKVQTAELISKGLGIVSSLLEGTAKQGGLETEANLHEYRASLADENAMRAEVFYVEKEEQARRAGTIDASIFRMKAELSGLSGASLDMVVGQRYRDVYQGIVNAQTAREQMVNRFIKEAKWHRKSVSAAQSSSTQSWIGTGLKVASGAAPLYGLYESTKNKKNAGGNG